MAEKYMGRGLSLSAIVNAVYPQNIFPNAGLPVYSIIFL
jgi:hypothetical protein